MRDEQRGKMKMTEAFFYRQFPQLMEIRNLDMRKQCVDVWQSAYRKGQHTEESILRHPAHKGMAGCPLTLLAHTRGVTDTAIGMADRMIGDFGADIALDRDIVIAGALLHDVGKATEHGDFTSDPKRHFMRHPLVGAILAEEKGCPWQVVYIIANHSPKEGHKAVQMPELFVVKTADDFYFRYLLFKYPREGSENAATLYKTWS